MISIKKQRGEIWGDADREDEVAGTLSQPQADTTALTSAD